jgi:two-component system, OmpR family, phosphate regulon sensor histidine kinase PhoR
MRDRVSDAAPRLTREERARAKVPAPAVDYLRLRDLLIVAAVSAVVLSLLAAVYAPPWWASLAAFLVIAGTAAAVYSVGGYEQREPGPGHLKSTPEGQAVALEAALTALERLPDPCLLISDQNRVVMANEPAANLFGVAAGRTLAAVFRVHPVIDAVGRVLDAGPPEDVSFLQPVPVERHFEAHVTGLPMASGQIFALLQMRETTALRRVERMRADFVANASHELRTPLASLSGFIETLQGPARDDPEAQVRFLDIMDTQAARMRRLIDDLLSLSRIELNEHVRPQMRVDLNTVIRDVLDAAEPLIASRLARIAFAGVPDIPPVLGARDELVQVVQNLIDNAVKYGGDPPEIRIALERREPDQTLGPLPLVALSVADRGPGIAREHLPRLTERFYRVDAAHSRAQGGTGLGLAIVKHILNRHLGRLDVESAPGDGCRFTVLLPAATLPAPPAS